MVELDGKPEQDVRVTFAGPVAAVREVNAQELPLGAGAEGGAKVVGGALVASFTAYEPRTFALRLAPAATKLTAVHSEPVALKFNAAVATNDDTKTDGGGFDGAGNALPAEMLPEQIAYGGVEFKLAAAKTGTPDAVVAKGQTVKLPEGHFNRVYILAAAADQDQTAAFQVGGQTANLTIEDWGGFIGQWDTRLFKKSDTRDWAISAHHAVWPPADLAERERRIPTPRYPEDYIGLEPGYVKPAGVAWFASHHHTADGLNEPYEYSYLFAYAVDLPKGARTLMLPENDKIRVLAVSVADENPALRPAAPLYPMLGRTEPTAAEVAAQ
jgi:alpha-mannosidase